jgi:hypothetical protein
VLRRPPSVTGVGLVFIAAGVIGLAYHAAEFNPRAVEYDLVWVTLVRLIAVVGGAFVLQGRNWARWLLVVWTAYHVILSAYHSLSELVIHAILLAVVSWILLRPEASAYFRSRPSHH